MDKNKIVDAIPSIIVAAAILSSFGVAIVSPLVQKKALDVIANLESGGGESNTWTLRGRVLQDGDPVSMAQVWVVLRNAKGGGHSPPGKATNDQGEFTIDKIPMNVGREEVTEAEIHAKKVAEMEGKSEVLWGQEVLIIKGAGPLRSVQLPALTLLPLAVIFLISVFVPFVGNPSRARHLFSISLAMLFTIMMIVYLSIGMRYVNTTGQKGEIISLGFASIFHGTHVAGEGPEWLVSLTEPTELFKTPSPDQSTDQPKTMRGFGAPLWVLLLAVLGSGLLTVSIILSEISERPDFESLTTNDETKRKQALEDIRKKDEAIVRHQFFILFAPLGAIFVYQALVLGKAAQEFMTVAITALGAGAALNVLLDKAINYSKQLIEKAAK